MAASIGILIAVMVIAEFILAEWMALRLEQRDSGSDRPAATRQ